MSLNEYDRDEVEVLLQAIENEGWRVSSINKAEKTATNETRIKVELRK
jgi:hypothetical protein